MDMKLSKLWEIVHRGAWTQLSDLKTTMPQNLHRFFPGWEWRTSNTAPYRQFATFSAHAICFYPCQQFSPCSFLRLEILVNVLDGIITQHILFLSVLQGNFAALPLHRQTSVCKGGICISHPAKKRGGEMERRAAWGRAGIGSALDPPEESECSLESHSFKIIPINNLLKYNILLKIKALIESSQSVPINPSIYHPSTYSLIIQLFFFFKFVRNWGLDSGDIAVNKILHTRGLQGPPWLTSGVLPMQGAWVQFLIRDLRPHRHERKEKMVAFTWRR